MKKALFTTLGLVVLLGASGCNMTDDPRQGGLFSYSPDKYERRLQDREARLASIEAEQAAAKKHATASNKKTKKKMSNAEALKYATSNSVETSDNSKAAGVKKAAAQQDVDDLKTAIRAYADDGSAEARAKLIPRLMAAISKLSPSDQVILNYYLEDKSSYIARSSEILCVSENYVSVRRNRIFKLLPKLMDMTRSEYLQYCLQIESNAFAGQIELHPTRSFRPNPILPSLSYGVMVEKILGMI